MADADLPDASEIDWTHLMDQFDGDLAVVCEIVEAYAIETRESVDALPEKVAAGATSEVRRQAHTLGGTMRMFGVKDAEQLARELETRTKEGRLEGSEELVASLLEAANRVLPHLDRFVDTHGASAVPAAGSGSE